MIMKQAVFLFLSLMTIVTACDPDWALHPQNQGWAFKNSALYYTFE